jgi:TolB-like protein/DNA-binding winged helix-turn-helix (wHTH) protein/Tfp pilus assembly protein PilF
MANKTSIFRFADIEVREREFSLIKAGEVLPVEPKAFRVLLLLLRNPQKLITKEELLNAVWGDVAVGDNSLARSIALLRRLLGDDTRNPRYIETVATVGYRLLFLVDVSEEDPGKLTTPNLLGTATTSANEELRKDGASPVLGFLDSIAVLPFENAGGEPEMEYLSDGITASIINNLSQVSRLRVVPRTTVFRYKGQLGDLVLAGRELRARVVLTGRVSQRGDNLTISVELIDAERESQLWGQRYTGSSEDILPIQTEIATQIANRLELPLDDAEKRQLSKPPTRSQEAYHLFLKSMYWSNKWTPDGIRRGVDYARQAIDVDPVYAEAWSALAYSFMLIGFFGGGSQNEMFARAKVAATKALDIDDSGADAHATLAYIRLVYDWDWQGALQLLLRAIELGPNLARGHYVYSHWLLTQKMYEEARKEARLALDIDPLSMTFCHQLAFVYYSSRHYDEAIKQSREAGELSPLSGSTHLFVAFAYAQKCMWKEAKEEIERGLESTSNDLRSEANYGIFSAMTGELVKARRVRDKLRQELKPPDFPLAFQCAAIHALLGEKDEAFACLDMARQGRAVELAYLAATQELESLHDDPRFPDLLRRIGIPASKT